MRPLRDYRFMTPYEKEWDRAFALSMSAMSDHRSDETEEVTRLLVDDLDDLRRLGAMFSKTRDETAVGTLFGVIWDRLAERVATEAAERATEGMSA